MGKVTAKRTLKKVEPVEQGADRPVPAVVQQWCNLLSVEGYRPQADQKEGGSQHWFVGFKQEGTKFGVYLDEQDPSYMQLELGYSVDPSIAPAAMLLALANEINAETKGVKTTVSPSGDGAWFTMEWFSETVPSPEVLGRLISQARRAAQEFFEKRETRAVPEAQA